jgi:hypothetical protein
VSERTPAPRKRGENEARTEDAEDLDVVRRVARLDE